MNATELYQWRHPTKWHVLSFGGEPYCLRAEALCNEDELDDVMAALFLSVCTALPPLNLSGFGRDDDRYTHWLHAQKGGTAKVLREFLDDYDNIEAVGYFSINDVCELLANADRLLNEEVVMNIEEVRRLRNAHEKLSRKFLYELTGAYDIVKLGAAS